MADFDPVSYMMGQKAGGGGGGGGGSSTLSGLTDVDISNPTDGQTLVYNATSGKWENGSGGGGLVVPYGTPEEIPTLLMRAGDIFSAYARGDNVIIAASVEGYGVFEANGMYCIRIDDETFYKLFYVESIDGAFIEGGLYVAESDDDYPVRISPVS